MIRTRHNDETTMAHGGTIRDPELFTTNSFCRAATRNFQPVGVGGGGAEESDPPLTALSSLTSRDIGH